MGKSGSATLLLLVLTVVVALLAISGTVSGLRSASSAAKGPGEPTPATHPVPTRRPMTVQDGVRQVEQAERDFAVMDSLAKSVQSPR